MANKIKLSMISARNERTESLTEGVTEVEGAEIVHTYSDPSETFWRQLNFWEFEISEMSLSSYLIAKSNGADMVMVPVFPSRRFMHANLSIHTDSGVEGPEDLSGKSIGVGEYQQTASLWLRGVLQHDFGVDQYKVDWWMERTEELSHGGATGFQPPEGIKFHRVPADKSLASMLVNHEIDSGTVSRAFSRESNLIDRSTHIRAQDGDWSKVKPLFPNLIEEGTRFFKAHGYIPANHAYAIRGDVDRQYPWLAFNLYKGFLAAKDYCYERMADSIHSGLIFGPQYLRQTRQIFGDDPYPYGVKANADMLKTIIDFSFEQGLTKKKMTVEEIFAPSTLDL